MMPHVPIRRFPAIVLVAFLGVVALAGPAAAHSELVSAVPAQGAVVQPPFTGPIVLTFSEHLATGSKADLIGPDGSTIAAATVDPDAKTMSFTLTTALAPGAYQVRWVSVADDNDVLRQPVVDFTVAAAASPSPPPSALPTASGGASPSPAASASPTAATTPPIPSAAPTAAPSGGGASGSSGDVVLPIIVALIVLGAGAVYLLRRRNRPSDPA